MKQCPRCLGGKLTGNKVEDLHCVSCGYREGDSFDKEFVSDGYYDLLGKILHGPRYHRITFAKEAKNGLDISN